MTERSRPSSPHLTMEDFRQLARFIHTELGIKMPDVKRGMVESRLRKRLIQLRLSSYDAYCDYLFSARGMREELPEFINQITTNKTDFFREPKQFTYLTCHALPELTRSIKDGGTKRLSIWSAACSRGHEPYTIAMVLSEFAKNQTNRSVHFDIIGTDISTRVLHAAKKAIYPHEEIEPVPMNLRKRYLLRSKDQKKKLVRIAPEVRSMVKFFQLNLKNAHYSGIEQMDIVFCRNVMIYFDKETQMSILKKIVRHIKSGGYLFMGHSEVIQTSVLPLVSKETTIYQKV